MATDVWNDRNYLLALMQRNPHDPLRQTAERQWELLNQREAQTANLTAHREALGEQISARREAHQENLAQREQRAKELADYRADIIAQRAEEGKDREAARSLAAIDVLRSSGMDPRQVQQISQGIINRYLQSQGIPLASAAPDATGEATRRYLQSQGVPTPGTTTPTTPTAPPAGGAPVEVSSGLSPAASSGAASGGAAPTPIRIPTPQGSAPAPGVGSASIQAKPTMPGFDYNVSTGKFVPSNTVGTIGGRPAGEVIAEGALRTGVAPESTSGREALAAARTPRNVPTNEAMTPTGPNLFSPSQLASAPSAPVPNTGPSQAFGPGPAPTPAGTPAPGPFSGAVGEITQGPLPTATPGPGVAPSPTPPPKQLSDEELRRRLAAQQQ